jgi:hypothetical protein
VSPRPLDNTLIAAGLISNATKVRPYPAQRRPCSGSLPGLFLRAFPLPFPLLFGLAVSAALAFLFTLAFPFALHVGPGTTAFAGPGTRTASAASTATAAGGEQCARRQGEGEAGDKSQCVTSVHGCTSRDCFAFHSHPIGFHMARSDADPG